MFNSKFFTVVIILTLLSLGAGLTFQSLEMTHYELWETLQQRFFDSK